MLTRLLSRRRSPVRRAAVTVAVLVLAAVAAPAVAGEPAAAASGCPKQIPWCGVPYAAGSVRNDAVDAGCSYDGQPVACYLPGFGYFDPDPPCYYMKVDPQPPASDPVWNGHKPGDGAIYRVSCFNGPPPWGAGAVDQYDKWMGGAAGGGGPTPIQIARAILQANPPPRPAIGLAPSPANVVGGLVGLPVWMWVTNSWGPITHRRRGVSVTERVTQAVWTMGDGHSVTCTVPGEPYTPAAGGSGSPNCGYKYTKPSTTKSSGKYRITCTETWLITWSGGSPPLPTMTTSRSANVKIKEQQVVVK